MSYIWYDSSNLIVGLSTMNQKGFTPFEVLVVVLVVAIFGLVSYQVWGRMNSEPKQANNAQQEQINDHEVTDLNVSYEVWTEMNKEYEDEDVEVFYGSKEGTASLRVYGKNSPKIYYSSNAPVYCQYESKKWQHYHALEAGGGEYTRDDSSDACESIEETEINGLTAFTRYGGASGQVRYVVAVENGNEWFVFSDFENYGHDREIDAEISATEFEEINKRLLENLHGLVMKTFTESI